MYIPKTYKIHPSMPIFTMKMCDAGSIVCIQLSECKLIYISNVQRWFKQKKGHDAKMDKIYGYCAIHFEYIDSFSRYMCTVSFYHNTMTVYVKCTVMFCAAFECEM